MPRAIIQSADDERIHAYRHLPRRKAHRTQSHFVVEGRWLVNRLLDSDVEVLSILCGEQQADEFSGISEQIPLYTADRSVIDEIVGFEFHRAVLACGRRPLTCNLEALNEKSGTPTLLAACAGVCDQENLGSVIRSCRAFGVDGLLLDNRSADAFSRRVMRVSAGAALALPIIESADLSRELGRLQREWNFKLVATVLDSSATPMEKAQVHEKMVVVFGNEGFGLDDQLIPICDYQVTLPMQGGVDSLNVGVASGIFLHHYRNVQQSLSEQE
mgnify:CR=1 FL=1